MYQSCLVFAYFLSIVVTLRSAASATSVPHDFPLFRAQKSARRTGLLFNHFPLLARFLSRQASEGGSFSSFCLPRFLLPCVRQWSGQLAAQGSFLFYVGTIYTIMPLFDRDPFLWNASFSASGILDPAALDIPLVGVTLSWSFF